MTVDASLITRVVGVSTDFKIFESGRVLFLPQRVALVAQGNTAKSYLTTKYQITSASEAAERYGYGSPIHLMALQLFPANGDGIKSIPVTVYPLEDDGSGVAASGSIAASGTQTSAQEYIVKINKIPAASVNLAVGATASAAITDIKTAIDSVLKMPVNTGSNTGVETTLTLESKWKGESANDIYVEIEGTEAGITFTVTQLTGGATNPDIDDALANIGDVWETIILNGLNYDDTTTLGKLSTYGEGRWGELVKKPLFSVFGTGDNLATRTAITDATAQKTDRTNVLIPAPGSKELPFVIAARAVARIAVTANNNPPLNYSGRLTGLEGGTEAEQETVTQLQTSLLAGSGTTKLVDGEIELNDTITMYHPTGDTNPAYRYVVDIVKLQNITFNVKLIFESDEWKGAPLLPDNTPTVNPAAKKPKNAKTALGNLTDNLALQAIVSDPETTKASITANISSTNPKRLDIEFPVLLSGNTEIIDVLQYFGFYFGSLT